MWRILKFFPLSRLERSIKERLKAMQHSTRQYTTVDMSAWDGEEKNSGRICHIRDKKEKCRFRKGICPVTRLPRWNTPLLRRSVKICQSLPNYPVSLPSLPASPTSHRRLSSGSHRVRTASWKISLYRCTVQSFSFPLSAIPWYSSPWRKTKECARWRTFICWTWWVFDLIPLITHTMRLSVY